MIINILTLFPEYFDSFFKFSIIKRAIEKKILNIDIYNIRDFSSNKHKTVDDYPYGGGAGMVMNCQPIYDNILHIKDKYLNQVDEVIYLSPRGEKYNQKMANELSLKKNIVLVCGHYEGVDERLSITSFTKEISIGDFVLSGGESAACIVVDSITRLLDGSIKQKSYENDSFYDGNFLDYPQFTRPFEFNNLKVPEVLLSGNHKEIDEFRRFNSIKKTLEIRPDLINIENLSKKDKKILKKFKDDDYYRKK